MEQLNIHPDIIQARHWFELESERVAAQMQTAAERFADTHDASPTILRDFHYHHYDPATHSLDELPISSVMNEITLPRGYKRIRRGGVIIHPRFTNSDYFGSNPGFDTIVSVVYAAKGNNILFITPGQFAMHITNEGLENEPGARVEAIRDYAPELFATDSQTGLTVLAGDRFLVGSRLGISFTAYTAFLYQ